MKYNEQFKLPSVSGNAKVTGSYLSSDEMGYRDSVTWSDKQLMVLYFERNSIKEDPSPEMLYNLPDADYFSSDIIVSLIEDEETLLAFSNACLIDLPIEFVEGVNSFHLKESVRYFKEFIERPRCYFGKLSLAINNMKKIEGFESKSELLVKTMFNNPDKLIEIERGIDERYPALECKYKNGEIVDFAFLDFGKSSRISVISNVDEYYNVTFAPSARVLDCDIISDPCLERLRGFLKMVKETYGVSFDDMELIKSSEIAEAAAAKMSEKGFTQAEDLVEAEAHLDRQQVMQGIQPWGLQDNPYFLSLLQKEIDLCNKK